MAAPTKSQKVPVEMWVMGYSVGQGADYRIWFLCDGTIMQERNAIVTYDPILLLVDGSLTLFGSAVSVVDSMYNSHKGIGVNRYDTTWYFDGGGFKGRMQAITTDFGSQVQGHCLLQGFGAFERQTLSLSYDGPIMSLDPWTGYLLKA